LAWFADVEPILSGASNAVIKIGPAIIQTKTTSMGEKKKRFFILEVPLRSGDERKMLCFVLPYHLSFTRLDDHRNVVELCQLQALPFLSVDCFRMTL
jgi:hypothetical protein